MYCFTNKKLSVAAFSLAILIGIALGNTQDAKAQGPTTVRGLVRAMHQATLSADIAARIGQITFREGQAFKKGDVLVKFDCRRLRAERKAAAAEHKVTSIELKNKKYLKKHQAAGSHDVAVALAYAQKSHAKLDIVDAQLSQCSLVAPFSGRVAGWLVQPFETPQAGAPIIKIVNDRELEIELIVPSTWLTWLRNGTNFFVNIDETGLSYPAKVIRSGAVVDAVSQTVKILAAFDEKATGVLPGMSGSANFVVPTH